VKIDVGSGMCLLARIYEPPAQLASGPELVAIKPTTEDAPIGYFSGAPTGANATLSRATQPLGSSATLPLGPSNTGN